MSEMGQSRHFGPAPTTSGLAPDKRTFSDYRRHVPNVPGTEVGSFSLYHLVREREQALRESGANHVSRLFVYDEFQKSRLLDRRVTRRRSAQKLRRRPLAGDRSHRCSVRVTSRPPSGSKVGSQDTTQLPECFGDRNRSREKRLYGPDGRPSARVLIFRKRSGTISEGARLVYGTDGGPLP